MKKIYSLLILTMGVLFTNAQLAIGKDAVEGAGIMDFALGDSKGILLPIVSEMPDQPANGTFVFNHDDSDENFLRVMVFENNQWKSLSETGTISVYAENGENLTSDYTFNPSTEVGEGVIIGTTNGNTQAPSGVLVLESSDKALILPKMEDPHLHMKSPRAGTMVYDLTTKSLVLFDGKQWNFWK